MKGKSFLIVLILSLVCIGCTSNKEKVVASYDNITNVMTQNGFTVTDNSSSYNSPYITGAYLITKDDIVIEFVQYDTEENAEKVVASHIESFNLLKSTGATHKDDKGKNFHKYFLISNNKYMTSVRVDNTVMFSKTSLANKDAIEKVFNELGY